MPAFEFGNRAALAACLLFATTAFAQSKAERELHTARATYEETLEGLRSSILEAAKADKSVDIEELIARSNRFKENGEWPDDATREQFAPRVLAARTTLEAAYKKCLESTFDSQPELATAVLAELNQWRRIEDLLPWVKIDPKLHELDEEAHAWQLPIDLPAAYRLEIRGTAKAGSVVRLVLPDDPTATAIRLVLDGTSFHAIVTFGPDGILAMDHGAERAKEPVAAGDGSRRPVLEAVDAKIELLRWKTTPIRAVTDEEAAAALPEEVQKQIRILEKKRDESARNKERYEKELATQTKVADAYQQKLVGNRGDTSTLRSGLATAQRLMRNATERIARYQGEIADYDAQIAELRQGGKK